VDEGPRSRGSFHRSVPCELCLRLRGPQLAGFAGSRADGFARGLALWHVHVHGRVLALARTRREDAPGYFRGRSHRLGELLIAAETQARRARNGGGIARAFGAAHHRAHDMIERHRRAGVAGWRAGRLVVPSSRRRVRARVVLRTSVPLAMRVGRVRVASVVPETVGAQGCAPPSPRDGVLRVSESRSSRAPAERWALRRNVRPRFPRERRRSLSKAERALTFPAPARTARARGQGAVLPRPVTDASLKAVWTSPSRRCSMRAGR
jgi:hypothetical protein